MNEIIKDELITKTISEEPAEELVEEVESQETQTEPVGEEEVLDSIEENEGAEDFEESEESEEPKEVSGFENCKVKDLYELSEQFPKENVMQDIASESFRIFAKGRTEAPEQIYSEYLNLRRSFEKAMSDTTSARGITGQEKSTRAYSGFDGAGIHRNPTSGLTKRQMQIARESGMSFREYAELLESVPRGRNL